MSDIRRCNIYQQDFLVQTNSDYEPVNEESTQSLQASVRKQQVQFALLTKEIDNERKTCAQQLNNNKVSLSFFTVNYIVILVTN